MSKQTMVSHKFFAAIVLSVTMGVPLTTFASESICQNNPALLFCDDFETGDYSQWGQPPANSPNNPGPSTQNPFTGKYSLKYSYGEFGGPSYEYGSFPKGTQEIWVRFYVNFDPLYHWGVGSGVDHTFTLNSSGGVNCTGSPGFFDFGPMDALIYRPNTESCMARQDFRLNMGTTEDRTIRNGKWYRIEYHVKLNSIGGCSDKNGNGVLDPIGDCDGVYEAWYNGTQVMGYYTANMRGNNDPNYYISDFLFNHYYRTGGQAFNGKTFAEYRDNLVIIGGSNGGRPIGPVANEPPLGTPDMMSPYKTEVYRDWVAFDANGLRLRPGVDCANSLMTQDLSTNWWDTSGQASFVSSPAYNVAKTPCSAQVPTGNDKSIKVQTMSGSQYAGDGISIPRGFPNKTYVLNHWIYLDPAAFPAANGAALSGIISYANAGRNYMAIGVDSQNHPTLMSQFSAGSSPGKVLAVNSGTVITPGVWHQVELRGTEGSVWSILLDGVEVIKVAGVNDAWFWALTDLTYHFGISDHLNNTKTLTAYADEMSAGSTSFQDCFGWNVSVCPFGSSSIPAPTPDTSVPSVPSGLSATAISTTQINLSWSASTDNVGVAGYRIYRNGTQIATVAGTSYSNTALTASTAYSYTVSAYDASNNTSAQSASTSATTQTPVATSTPLPSGAVTLVDFGATASANTFGLSGWSTVIKDVYTLYQSTGPGGTMGGGNGGYDFQGVTGTIRTFSSGDQIIVTWYNTSATTQTFTPQISMTNAGRFWNSPSSYLMSQVTVSAGGTAASQFTFNSSTAGSYSLVNVNVNVDSSMFICDKIVLIPSGTSAPDTTGPTVSLTVPISGATISGAAVTVSATASDNIGVSGVQFLLDGVALAAEDIASPYTVTWNTTAVTNTSHTLSARARDAAGNQTISTTVTVTVANITAPTPDTSTPTTPTGLSVAAVSSSQVNLSWSAATDNVAVSGYRIYRNGVLLTTTTATSYANSGLTPATAYSYTVSAYDAAGNTSVQSASASVTTQTVVAATTNTTPSVPSATTTTSPTNTTTSTNTNTNTSNTNTPNTTSPAGGSSGGVGSSVTTPATSSIYTPSSSQTTSTTPITPFLSLTRTLYQGAKGTDVKNLQTFLVQNNYLATTPTGFYGALTKQAVQKYQCAQSIVCSGTDTSTGYGVVGTKTRAKLNGTTTTTPTPYVSTSTLTPAQADAIIALIQSFGADAAVIARVRVVLGR